MAPTCPFLLNVIPSTSSVCIAGQQRKNVCSQTWWKPFHAALLVVLLSPCKRGRTMHGGLSSCQNSRPPWDEVPPPGTSGVWAGPVSSLDHDGVYQESTFPVHCNYSVNGRDELIFLVCRCFSWVWGLVYLLVYTDLSPPHELVSMLTNWREQFLNVSTTCTPRDRGCVLHV